MRNRSRLLVRAAALGGVLAVLAAACTGGDGSRDGSTPGAANQEAAQVQTPAVPAAGGEEGMWAKPPIGDSWADYFGVQLEATLDHSSPRVLNPEPGDLYFYTNSGTGWGATNTRNSVVVFDATDMLHWETLAVTHLPAEYSSRGSLTTRRVPSRRVGSCSGTSASPT